MKFFGNLLLVTGFITGIFIYCLQSNKETLKEVGEDVNNGILALLSRSEKINKFAEELGIEPNK